MDEEGVVLDDARVVGISLEIVFENDSGCGGDDVLGSDTNCGCKSHGD